MLGLFTPIAYYTDVNVMYANYLNYGRVGMFSRSPFNWYFPPYSYNNYNYPMNYYHNNRYNNYYSQNVWYSYPNNYYSYPVNNYYQRQINPFSGCQYSYYGQNYTIKTDSLQKSKPVSNPPVQSEKTQPPKTETQTNPIKQENRTSTAQVSEIQKSQTVKDEFLNVAQKYSNCKEADKSHLKFCINNGCTAQNNGEWCTDYVTYVVKEAYKNKGESAPEGFGSHDVATLKYWAIQNGYFTKTTDKAPKGEFIKENIKPGDIFILNENGASHTGFVTKVNSDGSFCSIEGNRDDKVSKMTYSPDYNKLSGFIQLT